ncbi:glycosyltransferase family 4 protein [Candidatus Uhrbacteria bacterium]|nr:glycosyltransferase family 4 protein [Candidatus Uhrbacteria bacterium]
MDSELNFLDSKASVIYGIDALSANKENRTGVENYSRSLIQSLKNHPLQKDERVVLYSLSSLDEELNKLPQGWSAKILSWFLKRGWMSIRMSWEMIFHAPTVLFVPGQALPIFCPRRVLTTIHDVAFARRPDLYDPVVRKRLTRVTKQAVKKATRILVPSQATKDDLVELYNVDPDRVTVVHLAADTTLYHPYTSQEAASVLQKYRLGTNFFLVVGRLEKKKNITTLIRAFELFKSRRGVGDPFELVFAGEPGYGYEKMKAYFDLSPVKSHIRQLGYVPDEDLAPLMSQATAYLFPSWYEGFGIPSLEAMASGTPVLASSIAVHKEVIGDVGILIPPGESEAWAQAMGEIVHNAALRTDLITKGKERAKNFSWEKTAQQTWEVLRNLVY